MDAAVALSTPRDHPGLRRSVLRNATDENQSGRDSHRRLRDAHRWLDELTTDSDQTIEALAAREGKTKRSIRMTLSLAFLSPTLAKAAMDGRLPRGFGLTRLTDLPMAWSDQWSALGLKAPAQA